MGKNKGGKNKVNPVFRVAGGKAAKAKAKFRPQAVNTNLKKMNTNNRNKIEDLDVNLLEVRDDLVTAPKKKEVVKDLNIRNSVPPADIEQALNHIASL